MADETAGTTPETTPTAPATAAPSLSWRAALDPELKNAPELQKYASVADLAKGHLNQSKLVGQKSIQAPGPDAKPEEIAAFRAALGVPSQPSEYKVKAHEMMAHPEWNREAQTAFTQHAHTIGLTNDQLNAVVGWYGDFIGKSAKDNQRLETEAKVELRNAWGANYDTYMGAANRGITRMEKALGMEAGTLVEATKGADPAAIAQLFHHIESTFVEHGFVVGEPVAGLGREEAAAKIASLQAELAKVSVGSDREKEIINQIIQYGQAAERARRVA